MQQHYYKFWRELIKPRSFDKLQLDGDYGKFSIEPLERGYGVTLGNSLRRVLLSSMMGSAVTAVKFEGVLHEFTTINGVLEDVTDIVLNLKEIRFNQFNPEPQTLRIVKKEQGIVTAADIQVNENVEVLNPSQHLATVSEGGSFEAEVVISFGRGYQSSGETKQDLPVGYIGVDALHSPVRRVNYSVSNARIGQRTDYDALNLEVWTDGSLKPDEALALGSKILKDQLQVFINFDEDIEPVVEEGVEVTPELDNSFSRSVDVLELSVRSANCLKNANIAYIGELVSRTEGEMLKTRNFGRKSLNEIKEILEQMGLGLGMDTKGWIPPRWEEGDEPPVAAQVAATHSPTQDYQNQFSESAEEPAAATAEAAEPAATTEEPADEPDDEGSANSNGADTEGSDF